MTDFQDKYYRDYYKDIHYRGALGAYTNLYHKLLEKHCSPKNHFSNVIEIGGGTGEHLRFVKHSFDSYTLLDLNENIDLVETLKANRGFNKVNFLRGDARKIPREGDSFDRAIATCVLLHIPNAEEALLELRRITKNGGLIDLYMPCDPGMLYRWIRHWTSHLKQKKSMNLSWGEVKHLWALEHRNHYLGVLSMCREIFKNDKIIIQRFPFPYFSWNFNLFSIIRITVIKN